MRFKKIMQGEYDMPKKVFLVSAVRTPIGVFGGAMRTIKPLDLVQPVILDALSRAGLQKDQVDQVIMEAAWRPWSKSGKGGIAFGGAPYEIPGYTINCACSSAMQGTILGAMTIIQGMADVVIAGGVESMSNAPYIMDSARWGQRLRHMETIDLLWKAMQEYPVGGGMGLAAERLADKYDLSRQDQDELAAYSHQRAVKAIDEGRFTREIVPVEVPQGKRPARIVDTDENPRRDISVEKLAKLRPAFQKDGSVTAGNASSLNDGAAALVLASEDKVKALGLNPSLKSRPSAPRRWTPIMWASLPCLPLRMFWNRPGWGWGTWISSK